MRNIKSAILCASILVLPFFNNSAFAMTRSSVIALFQRAQILAILLLLLCFYGIYAGYMLLKSKNKDACRAECVKRYGELKTRLGEKNTIGYILGAIALMVIILFCFVVINVPPPQSRFLRNLIYWGVLSCAIIFALIMTIIFYKNQIWYLSEKKKEKS